MSYLPSVEQSKPLRMQLFLLEPIREESWANLPQHLRQGRHKMKYKPVAYPVSRIPRDRVEELIGTPFRLAYFIRHHEHYGFGLWSVAFYDILKRNKKFKEHFPCIGNSCEFWETCKVKNRKLMNPAKYKTCKMNRKLSPNWSSRCWMEITPKEGTGDYGDDDFSFKMETRRDKMSYMFFWSKTERPEIKKINREDAYW